MSEDERLAVSDSGDGQREGQGEASVTPSRPLWLVVLVMTLSLSVVGLVYLSQAPFSSSPVVVSGGVPTVYVGLGRATPVPPPVIASTPEVMAAGDEASGRYAAVAAGYAALLGPPPHPKAPSAWTYPTASGTPTPTPTSSTPASPTKSGVPL